MAGTHVRLRISVLLVWTMVAMVVSGWNLNESTTTGPTPPSATHLVCSEVQQMFVMKQIGTAQMVPPTPVNGENLDICRGQSTCCTVEMEGKYAQAVRKDFVNIVRATSSHFRHSIANNVAKLQENFLEMIHLSKNNTHVLFNEVYKRMSSQAKAPVTRLFNDLTSFMEGHETVDVEESVSNFFDALFPLVFHHSINPKLMDFSNEYKECMQETQEEIRPFGDVARRLALHVAKSLKAARALIQALTIGVEAMNATDHAEVTTECQKAMVRLVYCPHCRGLVSAKPCNGYCINVVHGCLAGMAELEQPWNDFVSAIERLVLGMRGAYSIEEVMAVMDAKISEAIMHAMENGPELSKKVKRVCGHPQRSARNVESVVEDSTATASESPNLSSSSSSASPLPATTSGSVAEEGNHPDKLVPIRPTRSPNLFERLQDLVKKSLAPSKNFFSGLAETLCSDDNLAVRSESNCWNGQAIGEYTKTIVGFGMSAQRHNPEMELVPVMDQSVEHLIEKVKHMRQVLVTRITPLPESDSLVNDGSGSGFRRGNSKFSHDDDEDDDEDETDSDEVSGDGSGYGVDDDYEPSVRGGHKHGPSHKPSPGGDFEIEETHEGDASSRASNKKGKVDIQTFTARPGTASASCLYSWTFNFLLLVSGTLVLMTTVSTTTSW